MEEPWPRGRMPDSGAREPGFESSTYDGAVDGDTLWRQQNKILVIVLGNKLWFTIYIYIFFFCIIHACTHTRLHAYYMTSMIYFPDYIITILHPAAHLYYCYYRVMCFEGVLYFSMCLYIMCIFYYNPLSMNLMYMPCSFLFIYLLLLTSSSNILF